MRPFDGLRSVASALILMLAGACAEGPRSAPASDASALDFVLPSAREQPDSTRDAFAVQLRLAAYGDATDDHLAIASRLASSYAEAWGDSILVRRVSGFAAASAQKRRDIVDADSLWRAARTATGQGGVPLALDLWRRSLRLATAANDTFGRAAALYGMGAGHFMSGELDSAEVYLDEAVLLARAIADYRSLGNAVGILASVSKDRGELTRAARLYEEAASIRERSGDGRGMAADENNRGLIALELGDLDEAQGAFERAFQLNLDGGRDRPAALNLGNLGAIATLRGDYALADSYYERSLEINRATGDYAESAFVLHDIGRLAVRRGDYRKAAAVLTEALTIHESTGATRQAITVRSDLAAVQSAAGDFESALATVAKAEADAALEDLPLETRARLMVTRADLAASLGEAADADALYAGAEKLYGQAGDATGRADAIEGRSALMLLREDHVGALALLDLASRVRSRAGDRRGAAVGQLLIGEVQKDAGDTTSARRIFTEARETLSELQDPVAGTAATLGLADLSLLRGSPVQAESLYRRGLEELRDHPAPDVEWRLLRGLAGALRGQGALDAAATELDGAIASIEKMAGSLAHEDRRAAFLSDKWSVYAMYARIEQTRGRPWSAFAISERMRARQLLAVLDRGRVTTRDSVTEREQDLRRRIAELSREIEAETSARVALREPGLASADADAVREALDAAQKEYVELLRDVRRADPSWAGLLTAETVDWRAVAGRLGRNQAMLQYLLMDSAATVFVVTADTVSTIDLGANRKTIADLVDYARGVLDRPDPARNGLWRAPLRRLYEELIAPVEQSGLLAGVSDLVIVPHAELHFLPFSALLSPDRDSRYLIERYRLSYAPSASVWMRLPNHRPRSRDLLAIAPHTDRLPASSDEVDAIRRTYGRRRTTVIVGKDATERAVREGVSGHGIIHFATFGMLNKHNPLFSYVELVPDRADDGRLEVHEVFDLPLDGQLIVLSACQTALGSGARADVPAGDDWVGLMHGFLQAGAGGVLAALWPIDDGATAGLMGNFYESLVKGRPDAAALAEAQRAMLKNPETAHPFYWAGFVLNGSPGTR